MLENYQLDIHYKEVKPADGDFVLCFPQKQVLCRIKEEGILELPTVGEVLLSNQRSSDPLKISFTYLFSLEDKRFFTCLGHELSILVSRGHFHTFNQYDLTEIRMLKPSLFQFAIGLGSQLFFWYRKNRYCGQCGSPTVLSSRERCVSCPQCGNLIFPRINPSVIIAIKHEDKLLVTKYNPAHIMMGNAKLEKPSGRISLVAGYIESGESPEDTVRREAMEEVGLKVKNIRRFEEQAWPWTSSLLFGYVCEVDGDPQIKLETAELSTAEFVSREDMPDRSNYASLTSYMMEAFRKGII